MFKLTAYLIAAIGVTMYYADEIVGPDTDAIIANAQVVQTTGTPVAHLVLASLHVETPDVVVPMTKTAVFSKPKPPGFLTPVVVDTHDGDTGLLARIEPAKADITASEPALAIEQDVRWVLARAVNVRQGPSTSHAVIGKVYEFDAVQVLTDPTSNWVQIRIEGDGVEGYMASRFLSQTNPLN